MLAAMRRIDLTILAAVTATALGFGALVGATLCVIRILRIA